MGLLTGEWRDQNAIDTLAIEGTDLRALAPEARRQKGVGFIPEDRNGHAAVPAMTLTENTLLTDHGSGAYTKRGFIQNDVLATATSAVISEFDVRTAMANPLASSLSGGNLQKFVVGREIMKSPKVLIVSQPTWGVDIGAAQLIRAALLALAKQGSAIFLISQDLEEIFAISSHIAVLHNGRLSQTYPLEDMSAESVGLLMGGETLPGGAS